MGFAATMIRTRFDGKRAGLQSHDQFRNPCGKRGRVQLDRHRPNDQINRHRYNRHLDWLRPSRRPCELCFRNLRHNQPQLCESGWRPGLMLGFG